MNVDSISNGYVIDHITQGCGMKLYNFLKLDAINAPVALLQNVSSRKKGHKDIIKIDADVELNLDIIGFVDPGATVNIIRDGKLIDKKTIDMPEMLENVISCKNPRCISTCEQELPQRFRLTDRENKVYRCVYCETQAK